MGWKGALRTLGAMARQAERDAQRRKRALEKYRLALEKAEQLQHAKSVIQDFEEYLTSLISIHKCSPDAVDWSQIASATAPPEPKMTNNQETWAKQRLANYRPSVFAKFFNQESKEREKLTQNIIEARRRDRANYRKEKQDYEVRLQEYHDQKELAERILAYDSEAMLEVILARNPFEAISQLGSNITFSIIRGRRVVADFVVHGESIIPKETVSLLKTGKVSVKQMSKSHFYRIYQDYVCSATLRIARELFALLPIDDVVVTALDKIVNSQTGHLEEQPILSVLIPRVTFSHLNLDALDPSDSMGNFLHRMDFRQTAGFRPIERLDAEHIGLG